MKKLVLSLGLAAALLGPLAPAAHAWGFFGHRVITQIAVYELPTTMQAFYYRHMPELVRLCTAPDERRNQDKTEATRHFIDIDHYGEENPFAKMPRDYESAQQKFTADTLRKYGTVPWTVLDQRENLVKAFQERDTTAIIKFSAELAHYVEDAFVPLHTTVNYDGQLTNQAGLHSLWESQLPERFILSYKFSGEPAAAPKNPQDNIWETIQTSYGFLTATFDLESKVSKGFTPQTKYTYAHRFGKTQRRYSDAFADEYNKLVGGQVDYRMRTAAPAVASFWMSAWQEAGRPDLGGLMAPAKLRKDERDSLDLQLKAFKANTLPQEQLLLAQRKEKKVEAPDDIKAADANEALPPPPPEPEPAATVTAPAAPATKVKVKTKGAAGTEKTKTKP
ncbi:MAG: zinc dependent phospholipase C family protein [Janthinobacterium lividum]